MNAGATNPDLLAALEEARSHFDDGVQRRLLAALADSPLLVPVEQDPNSGELGIRASVNRDGSRHLLGFTSENELARWAPDTPLEHRVMSGRELAAVAEAARVDALWIDPRSEHGGRLSRDLIDLLAAWGSLDFEAHDGAGVLLRVGQEGLRVRPLDPTPSPAVLGQLHDALAADGSVSEAWLLAGAGAGAADVVLVVVRDGGEPSPGVAPALQQVLPAGASGDIYPISRDELQDGDYDGLRVGLQVFP
ncbi:MAG TPA: SseB family protein [Solirubrobacteraceae bacterium]|nr:SseB family protein [Solirubrobacteraceae bacterium]